MAPANFLYLLGKEKKEGARMSVKIILCLH